MSWYDPELVKCIQCNRRFSTPIDRFNHSHNCRVKRNRDHTLNVSGLGTGVIEQVKVVRGVIEEGSIITIEFGGKNIKVRVVAIFEDEVMVCHVSKKSGG